MNNPNGKLKDTLFTTNQKLKEKQEKDLELFKKFMKQWTIFN